MSRVGEQRRTAQNTRDFHFFHDFFLFLFLRSRLRGAAPLRRSRLSRCGLERPSGRAPSAVRYITLAVRAPGDLVDGAGGGAGEYSGPQYALLVILLTTPQIGHATWGVNTRTGLLQLGCVPYVRGWDGYPVHAVRGALGQAALRLRYVQYAGGWYTYPVRTLRRPPGRPRQLSMPPPSSPWAPRAG